MIQPEYECHKHGEDPRRWHWCPDQAEAIVKWDDDRRVMYATEGFFLATSHFAQVLGHFRRVLEDLRHRVRFELGFLRLEDEMGDTEWEREMYEPPPYWLHWQHPRSTRLFPQALYLPNFLHDQPLLAYCLMTVFAGIACCLCFATARLCSKVRSCRIRTSKKRTGMKM
jgi:hypothetical protein